jgi:hypothetical protein
VEKFSRTDIISSQSSSIHQPSQIAYRISHIAYHQAIILFSRTSINMVNSSSPPTKIQTAIKPSCQGLVRPRASISPKLAVNKHHTNHNQGNHKPRNNNGPSNLGAFMPFHSRDIRTLPVGVEKLCTMSSDLFPRHVPFEHTDTPLTSFNSIRPALGKRLALKPRSLPASVLHSLGVDCLQDHAAEGHSTKSRRAAFVLNDSRCMTSKHGHQEHPHLRHKTSTEGCFLSVPLPTPCRLLIPDDF